MGHYHYIDHTADLGIAVSGSSFDDLLTTIAQAIFQTQIDGALTKKESKMIECTGDTLEDLFVDWCRELLYLFSVHGFIPVTYSINSNACHLSATVEGDRFDKKRHVIKTEIKNVTYHDLKIEKTTDGYHTTVIFDV